MSLTSARFEREKARALVKGGANPVHVSHAMKATREEKANNTFAVIADELMLQRSKRLSPGSVVRERRLIDKDLAPIANTPITHVTPQTLLAALRKIEERGAIETAHRARSMASTIFRYAIASGRAERNPASDLAGALAQTVPEHFSSLTEPKQVEPLLKAIHAYSGTPQVAAALKLAPLTFVRPGELRSAKWADIDLEAAEWRFTTSKTQTPHIVPLSKQAVAILRDLHPITKRSAYAFPGARSASRPMSENAVNAALKTMGFDSDTMTGHGFRAMARTILDEVLGFRPDIIEHQLAHAVKDPLGRAYNRTAHLPERAKMMQKWSDYLDCLRHGADVVPLKRKV
jgi:integrase